MYYTETVYPVKIALIMMLTIVLKKTKQLSLRVSGLAKDLLLLEKQRTGDSEADIVERCILQCIRSSDAMQLIRKYAGEDPTIVAILDALQPSGGESARKKAGH